MGLILADNKKISLGRLRSLTNKDNGIPYGDIRAAVDAIIDEVTNDE